MPIPAEIHYEPIDPLRKFEYPAALLLINITAFVIVWKSVGLDWLPLGLEERFQAIFTEGYYPRDMTNREREYNALYLLLYGVLGTAAQLSSYKIATLRRTPGGKPGISRYVFAAFHLSIAIYHVLFAFQILKGKLIIEGMPTWQLIASQILYLAELIMACELFSGTSQRFFRRKVCLDVLSVLNVVPLLIYWGFAIGQINSPLTNQLVAVAFFTILPLIIIVIEYATWWYSLDSDAPKPAELATGSSMRGTQKP